MVAQGQGLREFWGLTDMFHNLIWWGLCGCIDLCVWLNWWVCFTAWKLDLSKIDLKKGKGKKYGDNKKQYANFHTHKKRSAGILFGIMLNP